MEYLWECVFRAGFGSYRACLRRSLRNAEGRPHCRIRWAVHGGIGREGGRPWFPATSLLGMPAVVGLYQKICIDNIRIVSETPIERLRTHSFLYLHEDAELAWVRRRLIQEMVYPSYRKRSSRWGRLRG